MLELSKGRDGMLNMNENIRTRRRLLGMTQEQLAQRIGVSAAAVSKWEMGASYPDVTLLPALARLLETDLNTLMSFEKTPDRNEVNRMLTEVNETAKAQGMEAGFAAADAILREYPTCGALLFGLAATLQGRMLMAGMTYAEREKWDGQLESWYLRASESKDEEAREAAAHLLASRYVAEGKLDEAQAMMTRLPREMQASRWPLEVSLLLQKGARDGAKVFLQRRLFKAAADIQQMLLRLVQMELDEGDAERAQQIADLTSDFVSLLCMHPYVGHLAQLLPALHRQEAEASVSHLRAMLEALKAPWSPGECLPYDRTEIKSGGHADMLAGILRELRESEEYAFLRENEVFKALLADHTQA